MTATMYMHVYQMLALRLVNEAHSCNLYIDYLLNNISHRTTEIEHSTRIHHISDKQREGLLRIKFVIYGTPF